MSTPATSFRFGPLCYALQPHDPWGAEIVADLRRTLRGAQASAGGSRTIHLCRETTAAADHPADSLPAKLRRCAGSQVAAHGPWTSTRNRTGCSWHSEQTTDAFWSDGAAADLGALSFQLPWNLLIGDMAVVGGGLMHGGLAIHRGHAVLFLAPPGGGKTTTLATAPDEWTVLSDDAALIWPQGETWLASPLPSWSTMTAMTSSSQLFDPAPVQPLGGLVVLNKGPDLRLQRLPAKAAATPLYRGLTEYPASVYAQLPLTEHQFRTACTMARTLPCWWLELPLGGDPWSMLAKLVEALP